MDNLNLCTFLHNAFLKIEVIMEMHRRCASYAQDTSFPEHIRDEEQRTLPFYRDILVIELDLILMLLFVQMDGVEGKSCHE